jgi:ribose transport system permease protein
MTAINIDRKHLWRRARPLLALMVLCVVLGLTSDRFFTTANGLNVLRQISVNICIATGMTLVILTAGIDLSVGSVLALCGAIAAGLITRGLSFPSLDLFVGFTMTGAVLSALLSGGLIGVFNGWMVTRFRLPPFVTTLAMLTIARGLTMLYTGGHPISQLGGGFAWLGSGTMLGIPVPVWMALLVVLTAHVFTVHTRTGRYIYAIGGNEEAARLSGINIASVKRKVYAISGALAALGGLIVTARLDSAQPNAGTGYELDAIAAVVIGGTSLSGGRGSVAGTVMGAVIIGVLNNGLVLLNVSPFWQQVVKGSVILLAVIVDRMGSQRKD